MARRTKIVCTLGPAVDSRAKVRALVGAGMNVARLNCSHGDWEARRRWIGWIRDLSPELGPVAVLVDLQGPKFRIGDIPSGSLHLETGQRVTLGTGESLIPVYLEEILDGLAAGDRVLLGDGEVELKIISQIGSTFEAKVQSGGTLKSRKGITVVNKHFDCPALTEKDLEDVRCAAEAGADFIALSYVRSADDIKTLRGEVQRLDPTIRLCAKIETKDAIRDLDAILEEVDLVMVARGDMGLQMELEDVPLLQKRIIDACTWRGRPVITATQMLESMMNSPRPTRAEATDVANAVLDGTDALMLSGETAAGSYPVECVKTMARIAEKAERHYDRLRIEQKFQDFARAGVSHTDAIAHSVANLTQLLKPRAIVTTTSSGQTPRLVSKFRPKAQILCAAWSKRVQNQMAVVWGVEALQIPSSDTTEGAIHAAVDAFMRKKRLKPGDRIIITAGVPAGEPGNTNLIMTQVVK